MLACNIFLPLIWPRLNAREKKNKWKNRLDELLGVDPNKITKNEEDKEFLLLQKAGKNNGWYR